MNIYLQFYEFNEKLILNLKYGREKVAKIAEEYPFVTKCMAGEKLLSGEGEKFVESYIESLGATDAASQIDYLNERKKQLTEYRDRSQEDFKRYSSLYLKICVLGGILVAVLLA